MNKPDFIPELLAPAGNPDKLRTCLLYGADAVYLGGRAGNLRAACEGFDRAELERAVGDAESVGSRIYYCLNSLARESDLPELPARIEEAAASGVHGFIIADPGVLRLARRYAPGVAVHLSTQANTCNSESVAFWAEQGVSRVNLARELDARDIHAVRKAVPDIELETFVHGAMCLAVSGQCLLSAWLNARSGNQGRCTQPCRFAYRAMGMQLPDGSPDAPPNNQPDGRLGERPDKQPYKQPCEPRNEPPGRGKNGGFSGPPLPGTGRSALVIDEQTRPGETVWFVEREERYSSFWAPMDLCLLPWLAWFARNQVDALKIEGRMKSAGWLAHVVDAYRVGLDALRRGAALPREACMTEVLYPATRPLGTGFFLRGRRRNFTEELLATGMASRSNRSGEALLPRLGRQVLARVVAEEGLGVWQVEAHGNWRRDRDVELMLPGLRRPLLIGGSYGLENQRGELVGSIGNGNRGRLYADMPGIVPGIVIRAAE